MLLSKHGIGVLVEQFPKIKFKGKGHERADLHLLMQKYEQWAQKLCPVCIDAENAKYFAYAHTWQDVPPADI